MHTHLFIYTDEYASLFLGLVSRKCFRNILVTWNSLINLIKIYYINSDEFLSDYFTWFGLIWFGFTAYQPLLII